MLKLVKPTLADLHFRQSLLADEETMSYNAKWGGTLPFPEERWASWYEKWLSAPADDRFYRYLYSEEEGQFVGETAYHFDGEWNCYLSDIIVKAVCRGRGYGREGLKLLVNVARENGLTELCDTIAIDNPSVELFKRQGFEEQWRDEDFVMVKKVLK